MKRLMASAALILAYLASAAGAMDVATLSFSASLPASYSRTITAGPTITVDLSVLPKETTVFRAVLRPGREGTEPGQGVVPRLLESEVLGDLLDQVGPLPDMAACRHPGCAASAPLTSAITGRSEIAGRSRSLPRACM